MTYDELKTNHGYKIPAFSMEWLKLELKKDESHIGEMDLQEIATLGKAGTQAIREISRSVSEDDTTMKSYIKEIQISVPILERKVIRDKVKEEGVTG